MPATGRLRRLFGADGACVAERRVNGVEGGGGGGGGGGVGGYLSRWE